METHLLDLIEGERQRLRDAIRECMWMTLYSAAKELEEILGIEKGTMRVMYEWPEWTRDLRGMYEKAAIVYLEKEGLAFVMWKGFIECITPDPTGDAMMASLFALQEKKADAAL